ncbi:glycosyltransferase family 4 protein [Flavobacterium sp. XN-5]|uniref:glycosyltransferase family 4 protein n=1 Tax=Flavobacterium sp. XN-5 TaxID=2599390 RepID=UPI0011CC6326|nr:glycosyltransferase family 4 protein [Flavobacterium sp. XN-5]NGY37400.1 glycosyltransferase family 4 protein [Flavobacterium sp. XN-5]
MHIGIAGPIHIPSLKIQYDGDRSNWPIGMGGVPVNHLINALLELGHQISVFSSSPEIAIGDSFEWHEENLSIYMGPHRARPRYVCKDFFAVESNYIKKAILKAKPDLVHAHWQYEWALGALKSGVSTLVTCHDSPVHVLEAQPDLYRLYRLIMSFLVIRKANNLTTVSDYCSKGLRYIISKKISVIPNFEPDEIFNYHKPSRFIGSEISIAMINNGFTNRKNVPVGILAFEQFRILYPNAVLHLYGQSFGKGEEADTWCKGRLNTENIIFHGAIPFNQLMKDLAEMDVFLHTSREESFGMVLVEAMAMGIPVIAGMNSGGPEWILKDGGGLLVDINSVEDVKEALVKLMSPQVYSNCSKVARMVAVNRFSEKIVVNQYLEAYKLLLKSE